jgi:hypothetical protein
MARTRSEARREESAKPSRLHHLLLMEFGPMVIFQTLDIPSTVALARSCKAGHRAGQPILAMWKLAVHYEHGALYHLVLSATVPSNKDVAKMLVVWARARTPPVVCRGLEMKMGLEAHLSLSSVKWLHAMGAPLDLRSQIIAAAYGRLDVVTYFHAQGAYGENMIAIAMIAKQHHITEFVLTNYTLRKKVREFIERNAHNALAKGEQELKRHVRRCVTECKARVERSAVLKGHPGHTGTSSKIATEYNRRALLTVAMATRAAREALPRVRDAFLNLGVDAGMQHLE